MAPGFRKEVVAPIVNNTERAAVIGAEAAAAVGGVLAAGAAAYAGGTAAAAAGGSVVAGAVAAPALLASTVLWGGGLNTWKTEREETEKSFKHAREVIGKGDEGSWFLNKILDAVAITNATVAVPGQGVAEGSNKVGTAIYPVYKGLIGDVNTNHQLIMNLSAFRGLRTPHSVFDDVNLWGRSIGAFTNQMGGALGGSSVLTLRFSDMVPGSKLNDTITAELLSIEDPMARDNRMAEIAATWLNQQIGLAVNDKKQYDALMKAVKASGSPENARYNAILRAVLDRFITIYDRPSNPIVIPRDPYSKREARVAAPIKAPIEGGLKKFRNNNNAPTDIDLGAIGLGAFNTDANTWVDNTGVAIFPGGVNDIRAELGLEANGIDFAMGPTLHPVVAFRTRLLPRIMEMFRHQPGFPATQPQLRIVEQELEQMIYAILMEQADPMQKLRAKYGATTPEAIEYGNKSTAEQLSKMVDKGRTDAASLEKPWFVYLPAAARSAHKSLVTKFGDKKPADIVRPNEDLRKALLSIPPSTSKAEIAAYDISNTWSDIARSLDTLYQGIETNMNGLAQQGEARTMFNQIARPYILSLLDYIEALPGVPSGMENRIFTWLANGSTSPYPWLKLGTNAPDPTLEREAIEWITTNYPKPTDAKAKTTRDQLIAMFGLEQKLIESQLNMVTRKIADTHRDYVNEVATNIAAIRLIVATIGTALTAIRAMAPADPLRPALRARLDVHKATLQGLIHFQIYRDALVAARTQFTDIDQTRITDPAQLARIPVIVAAMAALDTDINVYYSKVEEIEAVPV